MSKYKVKPLSPEGLNTYSLKSRKNKVNIDNFAQILGQEKSFTRFVQSLPDILAGKDFKEFISLMGGAKKKGRAIIFGLGAHVIKVGLSPIIIDLMKEGWITALALNGAGIIHDFEIAYSGQTSEDVQVQIKKGHFGMAEETGQKLNEAINLGEEKGLGLGEAVGEMIAASDFAHKNLSLLSAAYELNIPVTVHVALGTDTIHFHPDVKGDAIGNASLKDFFLFCSLLKDLEDGGVFVNVGSAVILPEVFLKALSLIRNKGQLLENFYTAVFDFTHHYRPCENVVKRPHGEKGKGFYFVGNHEIMIPLLAVSLKASDSKA